MYTHFFNLKQSPFSIAPDPRYLFMSERHREALAHLLYGVGSGGGFVLLTGEIGAGKTTVCRCFIEQIPANCRLAYIFNPKLTVQELLLTICDEFRIAVAVPGGGPLSVKTYVDAINLHLLASHAGGKNNVLIIDEAQNLSADVLEQLRLLTNLETNERKLLQVILIGQPELRTMLARPELEQLAQRVIARYHLGPLSEEETGTYIGHRLAVAGALAAAPFPPALIPRIHRLTHGVPRRINLLCDRALLGAYVENSPHVTRAILRRAAQEVFAEQPGMAPARKRWPLVATAVLAGVAVSAAAAWRLMPERAAPAASVAAVRAPAARAAVPAAMPVAHSDEQVALRELATLWGQALPEGDACQVGKRLNLRCHQGRGGLYELRQLDRPAILTLRDGPNVGYMLMTAMDEASVTLRVQGKAHKVPVSALTARFDGAYTTFWKMPRFYRDEIAAGGSGADVDWIAARLAQLSNAPVPAAGQALDARMQAALRTFQAAQNLKVDGVAGPRTYMRLNQLSGVAEPRLLGAANTEKR
ncbi:AAA family ATPase [Massilia sp. PAMC28688]|uniref:ExeA family protein n=1 Tax=Massilia sp. PAMC28688 TaxID=2861283 RepID=UPI001C6350E2|nr:ExeA family protein [Massilia sp. PAMC28688]QYF94104.1 AAA family ATPase [Massilia sp. PAMC28688]